MATQSGSVLSMFIAASIRLPIPLNDGRWREHRANNDKPRHRLFNAYDRRRPEMMCSKPLLIDQRSVHSCMSLAFLDWRRLQLGCDSGNLWRRLNLALILVPADASRLFKSGS